MPRERGHIWSQFSSVVDQHGVEHPCCEHCKVQLSDKSTATALVRHILSCESCPEPLRKRYRQSDSGVSDSSHCESQSSQELDITEFGTRINKQYFSACELALSRMIFGCNLPFSIVSHPLFIDFIGSVSPAYSHHLPSRHLLAEGLLDREYERAIAIRNELISSAFCVSIVSDGWTNIRRDPVLNIVVVPDDDAPVFWTAKFTKSDSHTAEAISDFFADTITEIGSGKVVSIITDNAANMLAAQSIMNNRFPKIATIGCVGHSLHLLSRDLLKVHFFQGSVMKAAQIITSVNASPIIASWLKETEELLAVPILSLIVPREQRWGTILAALCRLKRCRAPLRQMALNDERESAKKLDFSIHDILLDGSFWDNVDEVITILSPVINLLFHLESDRPYLYKVHQGFSALLENVAHSNRTDLEKKTIVTLINERFGFCYRRVMILSASMDPNVPVRIPRRNLIEICLRSVRQLCGEAFSRKVIPQLTDYLLRQHYFAHGSRIWSNPITNPLMWWKVTAECEQTKELCVLAMRLLSIPATSASSERNWWRFSLIHSKGRAALSNETAMKLVAVHASLRRPTELPKEPESIESDPIVLLEDEVDSLNEGNTETANDVQEETEEFECLEDIHHARPSKEFEEDEAYLTETDSVDFAAVAGQIGI